MKHTALLALGSNLGDREHYLQFAVERLGASVTAISQVYETEPIGGPDDQGAYLNMVIRVETELDPFELLALCQSIEEDAKRQRAVHWGPRTLDIDLLFYDDLVIDSDVLTVPHPRIGERRFVLEPLSEIAPERCAPGWQSTLPPAQITPRGPLPPRRP